MNRYPQRRSALIPSLQLAQQEAGHLSAEVVSQVAALFDLYPGEVQEVATFYTMLFKKPMGKYVIQVCTNISCMLCDSEEILNHLTRRLGIGPGETTSDRKFSLMEVECLGSCGTSPVMAINEDYYENLTTEKVDRILDSLE